MTKGPWIIILTFYVSLFSVSADIRLTDFLADHSFRLYWDDISQRGMIWRGTELISFMPNFPLAAVNLREFLPIDPLYISNGTLYIPEKTGALIAERLLPRETEEFRTVDTIFIDPGHGGKDPGAVGTLASGESVFEKDIVLAVSRQLLEFLRMRFPEKRIILSRDTDHFLTLEERTEMANEFIESNDEKVIFLSVHANASLNKQARGIELWYLPPDHRRQVIQAGNINSENTSVLPILNTLLEEEYTLESIILARYIEQEMLGHLGGLSPSRGLKEMDWYVVRKARMPSVLIELGFITNKTEVELLNNADYLRKLSTGIYNGLVNFIQDFESVSQ
ncbi:MAG: N-acetylmuramoyl-L-alanine amidase family protein [Salinispira sp.]